MSLMHISGEVRKRKQKRKRNIALNTKRPCFACAPLCLIELTSESEPRPTCRAENFIPPTPPCGISVNHSPERVFNGLVALSLFTPYLESPYGWYKESIDSFTYE